MTASRPAESHTIVADGVTLAYGDRIIVDGLELAVPPGRITAIVGANGCGKSTLLRALARIVTPRSGRILLDGKALRDTPTKEIARTLGLLPQSPTAPEGIAVADLVGRGRHPHQRFLSRWSGGDDQAVARALAVTGTTELADRAVDELSGGQRQRVWIAMALAQDTDVLLLDEPTTFLDVAHQIEVLDLLADLNHERGTTIVMVLHDMNLAARYADHVFAMRSGRIVAAGSPDEVMTEEVIGDVFDLDCAVIPDPVSGAPLVLPRGRHHARRGGRAVSAIDVPSGASDGR